MTATRARRVTRSFGWTTTPGRLRLAALALALAAVTFGLLVATTVDRHRDAARAVAVETEPLLVAAADLHVALSDADATAVTTFVTGGQEPPERRRRYLADVAAATTALTTLSRSVDPSRETGGAVLTIARELPVYTGLIETARANSHQGHPVGAAYLRQASGVMRERILPAAVRLYAVEARRLNRSSREGAASRGLVTVAVAAGGLLVLLVLAQVYLARLSQRVFNVPLVTASILLVVLAGWALAALAAEQRALVRAQRDGSNLVQVLSAARVLALRAQADEGLALAARGGGDASLADFDATLKRLGVEPGASGLLSEATELAETQGLDDEVLRLRDRVQDYGRLHDRVVTLQSGGRFAAAVRLSTGRQLALADAIRTELDRLIAASQRRFAAAAHDANRSVRGLGVAIPAITLACALLAVYGIQLRSREYR